MARKHRTAAQKAATRRMLAANRSRRSNPAKRRTRRRVSAVHHTRHVARRRRNPIRLFSAPRRHRRRRNPISASGIKGLLMPAVFGAAGAILVDAAMAYIPLPASMTTGTMGMVVKAGAAVLLGTAGRKVFGARATEMAVGSLTVQTYALMQQMLPASITGLGYVSPALTGNAPAAIGSPAPQTSGVGDMGMYVGRSGMGLGEYVR